MTQTEHHDLVPGDVLLELADGWFDDSAYQAVTPGVLDARAVHAFKYGQCHALAYALQEATGWPVQAAMDLSRIEEWPEEYGPHIVWSENENDFVVIDPEGLATEAHIDAWLIDSRAHHTVVVMPNGDVVDITGVGADSDWRGAVAWNGQWRVNVDPDQLRVLIDRGRQDGPDQDLETARTFVAPILADPRIQRLLQHPHP